MTHVLRINSSIKGEASVSHKLLDRAQAKLTAAHPDAEVVTRDLSAGVPAIDGNWIGAVFTPAESRNVAQAEIAAYSDALLAEVRAADVLLIGLPVYNFGVPGQLKSWFDHLARKGETFQYTEAGPEGLLKGKRAIVVFTSDGTKFGSEIDFASGWVRQMLGFFGITDVQFVHADQMVFDAEATLKAAEAQVDALAA
ncbi:FMN-dependent NADH-azoreductase [Antarcticimicrobium sediminis]|uniref:FMN dependent NADH:quinone oxidoreductase n=1 Tax=Antarcticimicrobium sediminis TaxID=2546227 RepID=A0A4R5ERF3_9RHOB|nr:NAD(P)H-dependent oxidoreductase [Antarcticimicrobium sediminis]TDE37421.1 FMN-dependent NADH-azoreductase [Antarcticimicrobium sediminis]